MCISTLSPVASDHNWNSDTNDDDDDKVFNPEVTGLCNLTLR